MQRRLRPQENCKIKQERSGFKVRTPVIPSSKAFRAPKLRNRLGLVTSTRFYSYKPLTC